MFKSIRSTPPAQATRTRNAPYDRRRQRAAAPRERGNWTLDVQINRENRQHRGWKAARWERVRQIAASVDLDRVRRESREEGLAAFNAAIARRRASRIAQDAR